MEALKVAKYIINKCIELEKPISNLQLQKIMYFVQLDFLKETRKKLITDEFKAWQYGPVLEEVYYKYRIFGSNKMFLPEEDSQLDLSDEEQSIINQTIEKSIKLPAWELVQKSHHPNGAWVATFKDGAGDKNTIPDFLIEKEALGNGR
ncbi:type II toxin-antitoxin system antitoxin SocA domain-containing protein [Helicobacter sp. 12S02232-10]|uniref:Panacea domain-containing protein n=1 Tax=Helicobacter sp. 12S02232-10 TaxID=1476197 RepID=UPI000BA505D6|nr:type II toxin-antitoxin system antitoxin SocA domain-containing protein [Helicobacter sp. 12S02232-10]